VEIAGGDWREVARLRAAAVEGDSASGITPDVWYAAATRRMDGLKAIEDAMTAALAQLCERTLSEPAASEEGQDGLRAREGVQAGAPLALLIGDVDPAVNGLELAGGVGFYVFEGALPRPIRSILDVLDAQFRRISDVSSQLDAARTELSERKVIERAKVLLMKGHQLTESRAYGLMREMAMGQNKRLVEVARAIIGMAERLRS
jgi:AmiR/NasT family two-component response regulator